MFSEDVNTDLNLFAFAVDDFSRRDVQRAQLPLRKDRIGQYDGTLSERSGSFDAI